MGKKWPERDLAETGFEMLPLVLALASFLTALILMPVAIKGAYRFGILDNPGKDKIHFQAVPRLGGVAIFIGFFPWALVLFRLDHAVPADMVGMILGAGAIFLVGLLDDIFSILPRYKFLLQMAACLIPIFSGLRIEVGLPQWFALPFSLFFILGASNSLNLIDGLDGLAGGVTVVCAFSFGLLFMQQGNTVALGLCMILIGSVLGFMPYNLRAAKVYMGDGGSFLLGYVLGVLAIMAVNGAPDRLLALFSVILILGFPIYDTFLSIIRRVTRKRQVSLADLGHTYNRLMSNYGLSHTRTVFVCHTASILLAILGVLIYSSSLLVGLPLIAALMMLSGFCAYKLRLYT